MLKNFVFLKAITILIFLLSSFINAENLPTIAVVDFTSAEWTELTKKIPDILTDQLVNTLKFNVVEREKLNSIMKEQSFNSSGFVNMESAIRMGNIFGAKYLVTGNIIDQGAETRTFTGYGVNTKTTFYRLKVGVKVLDTQSGKIVFSSTKDGEEKQYETGSMQIHDSSLVIKLAEQVCDKIIVDLMNSTTFKGKEENVIETVKVKITSEPKGADIEIDGVFYGNAGIEFEVSSGLHDVKISLPGYEVWTKKVLFKNGLIFNAKLIQKKDAKIEVEVK